MPTHRQVNEPQPTIVGPRPAEGAGGKVSIPQGMERLLTLAGISTEWREKLLVDPLGTAAAARIELSESERAILRATPPAALAQMAESFARRNGRFSLGKAAAGVAAAALLATGLAACGEMPGPTTGSRPDVPGPTPEPVREGAPVPQGIRPDVPEEAPPVLWINSLEAALAQAAQAGRALMVVIPPGPKTEKPSEPPPPTRGIAIDEPELSPAEIGRRVILTDSRDFRIAVRNANLVAARHLRPVANPVDHYKEKEAFARAVAAYDAALKKFGLGEADLPAVVFLAPDGSTLSKLVQPQDEAALLDAIKAVPPLLAKWVTEQRQREDAVPATKGSRPDVPEGKL
jgi:hypothetical protein